MRAALALCATLVACGPTAFDQDAGVDAGADAGPRRPPGTIADAPACGEQRFRLEPGMTPDILVVFDKSGSMSAAIGDNDTRWEVMTAALKSVVTNTEQVINWGLSLFPSNESCGDARVDVPVGPGHGGSIRTKLGGTGPSGNTPIRTAVALGHTYLSGLARQNPRYLLLATDGAPDCASGCTCRPGRGPCATNMCRADDGACTAPCIDRGPDGPGSVQAVRDAAAGGTTVIVVGLMTGRDEEQTLNELALAGGFPRVGGPPHYFLADSGEELEEALVNITGLIVSCTFPLEDPPPDPDNIDVVLDGMRVPRDRENGFELGGDGRSIVFHGEACEKLQRMGAMGRAPDIQATFGCPPPA